MTREQILAEKWKERQRRKELQDGSWVAYNMDDPDHLRFLPQELQVKVLKKMIKKMRWEESLDAAIRSGLDLKFIKSEFRYEKAWVEAFESRKSLNILKR